MTYHWVQVQDGILCQFSLQSADHGFTLQARANAGRVLDSRMSSCSVPRCAMQVLNTNEAHPQEGVPLGEGLSKYELKECENHVDALDRHPWQGLMGLKQLDSRELEERRLSAPKQTLTLQQLASIPASFDARTKWPQCSWLNSPQNQGGCGRYLAASLASCLFQHKRSGASLLQLAVCVHCAAPCKLDIDQSDKGWSVSTRMLRRSSCPDERVPFVWFANVGMGHGPVPHRLGDLPCGIRGGRHRRRRGRRNADRRTIRARLCPVWRDHATDVLLRRRAPCAQPLESPLVIATPFIFSLLVLRVCSFVTVHSAPSCIWSGRCDPGLVRACVIGECACVNVAYTCGRTGMTRSCTFDAVRAF